MNKKFKDKALYAGAVILALAIWQAAAVRINSHLILVSPADVLKKLTVIWREEGFLNTLLSSFININCGFFFGAVIGGACAVLAGRFRLVEILLKPYVVTIKSVPVASFIIVALMVFSSNQLSSFIAFLMVLPVIYTNILAGIHSVDRNMLEMADIFGLSWRKRFFYISLPGLRPYILSACSLSIGLAWKAGIAAELIGIPTGTVGEALYYTKVYFESADLFAWTVIIILISVLSEKLITVIINLLFACLERKK